MPTRIIYVDPPPPAQGRRLVRPDRFMPRPRRATDDAAELPDFEWHRNRRFSVVVPPPAAMPDVIVQPRGRAATVQVAQRSNVVSLHQRPAIVVIPKS